MGKRDTDAFMERFNRWKNGEQVYDKGRPINYQDGKDNEDNPSLDSILRRATKVYNNYSDAKDFNMNPFVYGARKAFNVAGFRSGISNCTLTATQWVDPKNPIKSAASIFDPNGNSGYYRISEDEALPGDLLITKNPEKGSYHTMLIESYDKNNKPVLRYSTGGASQKSLRTGVSLDAYHQKDNDQGGNHTEDHYFRYGVPIYTSMKPVIVKPANNNFLGFRDGKDDQQRIDVTDEIQWITNWLKSRKDTLTKNAESTTWQYTKYSPKNKDVQDVRNSGFIIERYNNNWNPLSYFKNSTPEQNRINKLIYSQIENAKDTPKVTIGPKNAGYYSNMKGVYVEPDYWDNSGNYIAFAGIPESGTVVHELTHASHPVQQERYINDIIFNQNTPQVVGTNKYSSKESMKNAKELYGALQQFRFENKLDPKQTIDLKWIDDNRDLFESSYLKNISDEDKIRLFNEVAYNMQSNNKNLLYAKNGKDSGIHIKPSHRGRLTALKKRTGKSEAELYRTGGPAVRKMITFARNARKWHHN